MGKFIYGSTVFVCLTISAIVWPNFFSITGVALIVVGAVFEAGKESA